jgi:hypothetical protein
MNPSVQIQWRNPGRFRIGDRVRITRGFAGAEAEILEDHGPLGPDNQRFYTVRVKRPDVEEFTIDYPEDEMEPFPRDCNGPKAPDRKARPHKGR